MTEVGITDLAGYSETVAIDGQQYKLRGMPLRIVVDLIKQYPDIVAMLNKGLTAEAVVAQGAQAVELIIAAGLGKPDDIEIRKWASDLSFDQQLEIVAIILKATMGGGAGPFGAKINKIYDAFKVAKQPQPETLEAVRARKLERMKQRLSRMQSQQISNSSSPEAVTEPQKFGT